MQRSGLGVLSLMLLRWRMMPEPDPLISTEEEVEVDAAISAAIERGIRDADEGRTISADDVRALLSEWKQRFTTQKQG